MHTLGDDRVYDYVAVFLCGVTAPDPWPAQLARAETSGDLGSAALATRMIANLDRIWRGLSNAERTGVNRELTTRGFSSFVREI